MLPCQFFHNPIFHSLSIWFCPINRFLCDALPLKPSHHKIKLRFLKFFPKILNSYYLCSLDITNIKVFAGNIFKLIFFISHFNSSQQLITSMSISKSLFDVLHLTLIIILLTKQSMVGSCGWSESCGLTTLDETWLISGLVAITCQEALLFAVTAFTKPFTHTLSHSPIHWLLIVTRQVEQQISIHTIIILLLSLSNALTHVQYILHHNTPLPQNPLQREGAVQKWTGWHSFQYAYNSKNYIQLKKITMSTNQKTKWLLIGHLE